MPFEEVWQNNQAHDGQQFHTVTGLPFTYQAREGYVRVSRARQNIGRADFQRAYALNPRNVAILRDVVRGSAYVFSILRDPRVAT